MGSVRLSHEGVSIEVTWPPGAMDTAVFARTIREMTDLYEIITGSAGNAVPASALTYDSGEGTS